MLRKRWLLMGAACLVLSFLAVSAVWLTRASPRIERPPPEVRAILPSVVRCLDTKDGPIIDPNGRRWTVLCKVRYLGKASSDQGFELYVWEACQSYRAWEKGLARSTGWSTPAVISMAHTRSGYRPVAEHQPVAWPEDVRRLFPSNVQSEIFAMDGGEGVGAMFAALDRRARHQLLTRRPAVVVSASGR